MLKKIKTMNELETIFEECFKYADCNTVAVEVSIPGYNNSEFIITKKANIKSKLNYYKKFFNENLINNKNENIKILSAGFGSADLWE